MHLRRVMKRMVALGLAFSLSLSSITVTAGAAEPSSEKEVTETVAEEAEVSANTLETSQTPEAVDTAEPQAQEKSEETTENEEQEEKEETVVELKSAKVTVEKQSYGEGTASIKVAGLEDVTAGIDSVMVAVWSKKDQSDLFWYTAQYKNDGWYADMDIAKYHKDNWGTYTVHVYATDGNGTRKMVGSTEVNFTFKSKSLNIDWDTENQKAIITIEKDQLNVPSSVKEIKAAIWSGANGQDDLNWYTFQYNVFTSKWTVEIPLTQLKSLGICYVHTYLIKNDGSQVFAGGSTYTLKKPSVESVKVETVNADGTFTVNLNGVKTPLGSKKVKVAVWSQGNQSDLVWYEAKQNEDGTYSFASDISKHKYNIGKYYLHCYITDGLGINTCVACTTMEFTKKVGTLTAEAADKEEVLYTVSLPVSEYPAGLKSVQFGVWSNHNGQDDLKWYDAKLVKVADEYQYQCAVDIKNHKTSGTYSVHAYGVDNAGKKVFLAGHGYLIDIKGTVSGKIQVSEKNNITGTFKVTVTDVKTSSSVSTMKLAVWTQSNQSDLYWYTCTKQSDGSFAATIDVANHKYNSGTFVMHAYATLSNGIEGYTAGTADSLEPLSYTFVANDLGKTKRTLGIINPSSTTNLRFAVWSETKGQDDLTWYTATSTNGKKWTATLKGGDFKNGGTFNVHVYSGNTCLKTFTFEMPADEVVKNGWFYETINGRTYKLYYVDGVKKTDVTSVIGPQSSYTAEVNRTTCTVTIYAKDTDGTYCIPVKVFACSVGLPATPTPVGIYYTQAKYRWHELMGPSYGQYCTRIVGGILFHSVAGSNMTSYNISAGNYNMLGQPASHGCVRLTVRDAKWIYDNCPLSMKVRIYDSSYPGPLGKPATIKIPASQNWDPTDPNV